MIGPASADPPRGTPRTTVLLTRDPLDVAAATAAVADASCGGVAVFVGTVRDHHLGDPVASLTYEAWEEVAVAAMNAVAAAVLDEWRAVRAVYVAHRMGDLAIGDASVIVAAAAPHRADAVAATRALIDRVKETVPIWKKEHLVGGASRWPGTD